MGKTNGNHGSRYRAWRAWCHYCQRCLAMNDRENRWPDEIRCPLCGAWCKVVAVATVHLKGDVICPHGSGRNRVEE